MALSGASHDSVGVLSSTVGLTMRLTRRLTGAAGCANAAEARPQQSKKETTFNILQQKLRANR